MRNRDTTALPALLQELLRLLDPGIDAFLVLARRAGNADGADHLVTNFDRQPALIREGIGVDQDAQSPALQLIGSSGGRRP